MASVRSANIQETSHGRVYRKLYTSRVALSQQFEGGSFWRSLELDVEVVFGQTILPHEEFFFFFGALEVENSAVIDGLDGEPQLPVEEAVASSEPRGSELRGSELRGSEPHGSEPPGSEPRGSEPREEAVEPKKEKKAKKGKKEKSEDKADRCVNPQSEVRRFDLWCVPNLLATDPKLCIQMQVFGLPDGIWKLCRRVGKKVCPALAQSEST